MNLRTAVTALFGQKNTSPLWCPKHLLALLSDDLQLVVSEKNLWSELLWHLWSISAVGALRGIYTIQVCWLGTCVFLVKLLSPKKSAGGGKDQGLCSSPMETACWSLQVRHWQKSRAKHVFFAFFLEVPAEFLHWHHLSEEVMGPMQWHEMTRLSLSKLWLFKLVLSSAANLLIEISSWTFKLKLLPFDIPLWFYDELNTIDHDQQLQQFCIHRVHWYPKYRVSSTHITAAVRYVHRSCYSCVTWVKEVFFAETCASKVARSATKPHVFLQMIPLLRKSLLQGQVAFKRGRVYFDCQE